MAKTTVIIDGELPQEAMKVTGATTKKQVIADGLRELIHKRNLEAFHQELGNFDLALSIEELQKLTNA